MFGLGKKKITGSEAAVEFVTVTNAWNEKTFDSFKLKLQEALRGCSFIHGVSAEPQPKSWEAVKVMCFVSQLALGTNNIRVLFSDRHYNAMINHIAIALENWESSFRQKTVLKSFYFEDMLKIQSSINAMSKGIALTPDIAIAESFLSGCGFLSKDFKPDVVSNLVLIHTGVLLIEFNAKFWKMISERNTLVI